MGNRSDSDAAGGTLRESLIGLGEHSHRKSYYPELQKRLEELERFKAFLDYSHDAIFLVDVPRGRIVDFNDSAARQSGWDADALAGRSIFEVFEFAGDDTTRRLISADSPFERQRARVETRFCRRSGETLPAELTLARMIFRDSAYVIVVARDISKRKAAEEALGASERSLLRLETQLEFAAQMQERLLPCDAPQLPGFEIAARCLPAYQVGGDFYDWQEPAPGFFSLTLGDVMGKGPAAAMLMATVRASLRAVAQSLAPVEALAQAELALRQDLSNAESFVTLFHARLEIETRRLSYVDCGHGCVFLLRADGRIEELLPRGLPFGIVSGGSFEEGVFNFQPGDCLVLFSDGLIDALEQTELDNSSLARHLWADDAQGMVDRLVKIMPPMALQPDDMTLVVLKCTART